MSPYTLNKGLAKIFLDALREEYTYKNMLVLARYKKESMTSFEDIREHFQMINKNYGIIDDIHSYINSIYATGHKVNERVFEVYCKSLLCCIEGPLDMQDKLQNILKILKKPVDHKILIVEKL